MPLNAIGQARYKKTQEMQANLQRQFDDKKKEIADFLGVGDANRIKLARNPWTYTIVEVYLDGEPVDSSRLGWN